MCYKKAVRFCLLYFFVGAGICSAELLDAPEAVKIISSSSDAALAERYASDDRSIQISVGAENFKKFKLSQKAYIDRAILEMQSNGFTMELVEETEYKGNKSYSILGRYANASGSKVYHSRTDIIFLTKSVFILELSELDGHEGEIQFDEILGRVNLDESLLADLQDTPKQNTGWGVVIALLSLLSVGLVCAAAVCFFVLKSKKTKLSH